MRIKIRAVFPFIIAIALFAVSNAQARYENDLRISTLNESAVPDFVYPEGYQGDTSQPPDLDQEVSIYFEQGYHPVSVLFFAMRNGMSANDAIDLAEQAGVPREHLEAARDSVEPVLPGSVCAGSYFAKDYTGLPGAYSVSGLNQDLNTTEDGGSVDPEVQPTLTDIINRYFDDNKVISINQDDPSLHQVYNPGWPNAAATIPAGGVPGTAEAFLASGIQAQYFATGEELLALANQSDANWYYYDSPIGQGRINSESLNASAPIEITLFSDAKEAVVAPGQMDRIQQAVNDGARLPVMLFYGGPNAQPVSQVAPKIGYPELANAYILHGIKAIPVPSWEHGNYMTLATAQQLTDSFDLPAKDDIPEERYSNAVASLENGRPLQIAMVGGKMFIGNPDRAVAMIEQGGSDFLPVNISYVDLEPDEDNFSVCAYAFPFAGGLGRIGSPTASGIVFLPPPPPDCVPTTKVINKTYRVKVHTSPDRYKTVTIKKVITIPCPPES